MSIGKLESELLDACLREDRRAQRMLFEKYYSWGLNLCLRYARNEVEAGEMLNDGFLRAFKGLPSFRREGPFRPWLKRVLINACINYLRRKYQHLESLPDSNAPFVAAPATNQLNYEDILLAVQALPPTYRTVFNLYEMEGYSHLEIAGMLGISEGTSRSNLLRAKNKLQSMLRDYASTGKINYGI